MSAEAPERSTSAPGDRRIVPARTPRLFLRNRAIDLALASPLILAVLLLNPYTLSTGTINQQLVAQILAGGDADGPAQPAGLIPRVLVTLLPHENAHVILALVGALLGGRLLHYLLAALWRESVAVSVTTACLLTLAASPLFAFIALTNFPLILAMTLFAMSVVGAMRMAMWNDTRAGFNAGATLLLAVLSHPLALVCAAVLAVSMPFLPHARGQHEGSAGRT
ncbi:hypothetical protein [Nesterenkonia sp. NBAIMH1]|uniref:hypothetical protein n=1 Tax=Nesterenkonia sp. NBAIMH1 TaxID=2600320 RepID=UPI0011B50615|nr:hypothetical protein [Nesterenkonia sp. NBAIMH1]